MGSEESVPVVEAAPPPTPDAIEVARNQANIHNHLKLGYREAAHWKLKTTQLYQPQQETAIRRAFSFMLAYPSKVLLYVYQSSDQGTQEVFSRGGDPVRNAIYYDREDCAWHRNEIWTDYQPATYNDFL